MRHEAGSRNDASWGNEDRTSRRSTCSSLSSFQPPSTIMDGYAPPTVHKSDLFFTTPPPPPPIPQNRPPTRHSYSARKSRSPPNRNRSSTSPGPINLPNPNNFIPPPPPPPLKLFDPYSSAANDDLHRVIELSRSESARQTLHMDQLNSQEEGELARALAESMRVREPYTSLSSPGAGPSRPPPVPNDTRPRSTSSNNETWSSPPQTSASLLDDEALARQLAAEEERADLRCRESSQQSGANQQPSTENDEAYARQLEEDEAYARQLALEEEGEDDKHLDSTSAIAGPPVSSLPTYADVISPPNSSAPIDSSLPVESSLIRSNSSASAPSYVSASERIPNYPSKRADSDDALMSDKPKSLKEQLEADRNAAAINVNQFVDKELLDGVTIGFWDPVVLNHPEPMSGVMPNIISLPYGKSPPLHLQATSWRHLLKLMARFSGTRIEPTPEATQRNEELRLRTVVQFVRPHYDSLTWRTLVWFTIDHDAEHPPARRNPMGDVESLPLSYSLMKIPPLLRDGSSSPISKIYTIPSTQAVPYPVLPISFPNLALYLQAALSESRKYLKDGSSGIGKLAKMLEYCFPKEFNGGTDAVERSGVSGLFKKVIGRGGKSSKKGRSGNEETYDLVTPFVPDEWG
ncbi:hypothetical protein GYMLUDRAFT_238152 [Collybiopsis luxurians FD-317 M1]|nr:hypothetical protein GYMLUDRAFT_238152 [Collybiopsis luxurians FD-317 M1]